MRKKFFILCLIGILFCSLGLTSNAVEDTPDEVDINEVKIRMEIHNYLDGKTFKDGAFGNFYRIEVDNVKREGHEVFYHFIWRDVEICFASRQEQIEGRSRIPFKFLRSNTASTFVAFDNGAKRGYEYTLLHRIGLTTDRYTDDRNDQNAFDSNFDGRKKLYTSEIRDDSHTEYYDVDSTKKHAHLVLIGDVYISRVRLVQIQKLMFGENALWSKESLAYVFSNIRVQVVSFD